MQLLTIYKIIFFTAAAIKIFTLLPGNEHLQRSIPIVELVSSKYFLPFGITFGVAMINNGAFIFNLDLVARGTMHLLLWLEIDYILLLAGLFRFKKLIYSFIALGYLVYGFIQDVLMQPEHELRVIEVPSVPAIRRRPGRIAQNQGNDVSISRRERATRSKQNQGDVLAGSREGATTTVRKQTRSAPPTIGRARTSTN